jgi:hypothetical protein
MREREMKGWTRTMRINALIGIFCGPRLSYTCQYVQGRVRTDILHCSRFFNYC